MEKRKLQITLKQRIGLCLAAFFAALAMQIALNGYQSRAVQAVQDEQMGSFNAVFGTGLAAALIITVVAPLAFAYADKLEHHHGELHT